MRHRITFLAKSSSRSPTGAETTLWSTFQAEVPAEVQPIAGREYVAMRQAQADITVRFRTRYLPGVNTAMRVRWQSDDYDIREVIDVNARHRELEILCVGAAGNV